MRPYPDGSGVSILVVPDSKSYTPEDGRFCGGGRNVVTPEPPPDCPRTVSEACVTKPALRPAADLDPPPERAALRDLRDP